MAVPARCRFVYDVPDGGLGPNEHLGCDDDCSKLMKGEGAAMALFHLLTWHYYQTCAPMLNMHGRFNPPESCTQLWDYVVHAGDPHSIEARLQRACAADEQLQAAAESFIEAAVKFTRGEDDNFIHATELYQSFKAFWPWGPKPPPAAAMKAALGAQMALRGAQFISPNTSTMVKECKVKNVYKPCCWKQ